MFGVQTKQVGTKGGAPKREATSSAAFQKIGCGGDPGSGEVRFALVSRPDKFRSETAKAQVLGGYRTDTVFSVSYRLYELRAARSSA